LQPSAAAKQRLTDLWSDLEAIARAAGAEQTVEWLAEHAGESPTSLHFLRKVRNNIAHRGEPVGRDDVEYATRIAERVRAALASDSAASRATVSRATKQPAKKAAASKATKQPAKKAAASKATKQPAKKAAASKATKQPAKAASRATKHPARKAVASSSESDRASPAGLHRSAGSASSGGAQPTPPASAAPSPVDVIRARVEEVAYVADRANRLVEPLYAKCSLAQARHLRRRPSFEPVLLMLARGWVLDIANFCVALTYGCGPPAFVRCRRPRPGEHALEAGKMLRPKFGSGDHVELVGDGRWTSRYFSGPILSRFEDTLWVQEPVFVSATGGGVFERDVSPLGMGSGIGWTDEPSGDWPEHLVSALARWVLAPG
jgi:hypothetical protein